MSSLIFFIAGAGLGALIVWLVSRARSAGQAASLRSQEEMKQTFTALSAEVLRNNSESFLQIARTELEKKEQAAKLTLDQRQTAIADLVTPIKEGLEKYDRKIAEIELERAKSFGALNERLETLLSANTQLRSETQALVSSLRSTTVRGRWGEIALKRVAELAGMLDHCDFTTQESTEGDVGRQRPDMVVNLAGGRSIAVDAKVPLDAYLAAMECEKESDRVTQLKRHAAQVRAHAKMLGAKAYWNQLDGSPDAVVMFLPGEVYFAAALQSDASLLEEISGDKVILASPTTLIALLKSCAYGWRQEKLAANATEISELGRELYGRMGILCEHISRIGKSLGDSVKAYNEAVSSIESRVLVTGRKFRALGELAEEEIQTLAPIERLPREPSAPELLEGTAEPPPPS
jgi:DNA recombination protein RmuC